jgi:hypothetical protein
VSRCSRSSGFLVLIKRTGAGDVSESIASCLKIIPLAAARVKSPSLHLKPAPTRISAAS